VPRDKPRPPCGRRVVGRRRPTGSGSCPRRAPLSERPAAPRRHRVQPSRLRADLDSRRLRVAGALLALSCSHKSTSRRCAPYVSSACSTGSPPLTTIGVLLLHQLPKGMRRSLSSEGRRFSGSPSSRELHHPDPLHQMDLERVLTDRRPPLCLHPRPPCPDILANLLRHLGAVPPSSACRCGRCSILFAEVRCHSRSCARTEQREQSCPNSLSGLPTATRPWPRGPSCRSRLPFLDRGGHAPRYPAPRRRRRRHR